ncbi:MAG: carbonic anhydrase [Bacteroidales bacterium]|jgi:carbonic anhydrase|nr:carbonic anhydrase [Bacteroidales bacterium]
MHKLLSKEEQCRLTPAQVIAELKQGNYDFVHNQLTVRNNSALIRNAAGGVFPQAVILSCLDARIPVEDVFHRAIGDVFVVRGAGNSVNRDVLGSMEFACKISGAKLVLILGHGGCYAIKSAIANITMGNVSYMLAKIQPAVQQAQLNFTGEISTQNEAFTDTVSKLHVKLMVQKVREESSILREMENTGEIQIVGAYYNIHSGEVEFFE